MKFILHPPSRPLDARAVRSGHYTRPARPTGPTERVPDPGPFSGSGLNVAPAIRPSAWLVAIGAVHTIDQAFRKYLGGSRGGALHEGWAELPQLVEWIRAAGGCAFVQDEATSMIYGMPRAVVEAGLADEVVPLDRMADAIVRNLAQLSQRPLRRAVHA